MNLTTPGSPRTWLAALVLSAALASSARSENVPLDHPCSAVVKSYLAAVVEQDWKSAADMLLPTSLERKKKETIAVVRMAPTMTEEQLMLEKLGVKDIKAIEKLTPQELYVADRLAVHKKMNIPADVKQRKKDTLKIDILGLAGEDENRVIHATVRTSQETPEAKIEELFLISMVQDKADAAKWLIVPDMMRPITTPLDAVKAKEEAAAAAAAATTPPAPAAEPEPTKKGK